MEQKAYMLTDREADILRDYVLRRLDKANERVKRQHSSPHLDKAQRLHDLAERLRG